MFSIHGSKATIAGGAAVGCRTMCGVDGVAALRAIFTAVWVAAASGCASNRAALCHIDSEPANGRSAAVAVGLAPLIHTGQILPTDARGGLVGNGDAKAQVERALANLSDLLAEAGCTLDQVAKLNVYVADPSAVPIVEQAVASRFPPAALPAMTCVVSSLALADALVAIDAVAVSTAQSAEVQRITSPRLAGSKSIAHAAILPPAGVVYISGQAEKADGDLANATAKTLESLGATLNFLDLDKSHVVQVKTFMGPTSAIDVVNAQVAAFFAPALAPPTVHVEWIPGGVPIEIELVVSANMTNFRDHPPIAYLTPPGMTASPVYSKVARVRPGPQVYLSGILANAPGDGAAQVHAIFASLGKVLQSAGGDFHHLAKATYYVSDPDPSRKLNALRPEYYHPARPPAASKAMVRGVGKPDMGIAVDMIAVPARTQ